MKRLLIALALLAALAFPFAPTAPAKADPGPMASAEPSAPGSVFLNEDFSLTVTFDNTGDATGFGPLAEVHIPPEINLDAGSASYLGVGINVIEVGVFDSSGELENPLTGEIVTGTEGELLLVLEYPFGSVTDTQPAASVTIDCTLNPLAVLGSPLTILAEGVFRYGADPQDNPSLDAPIRGTPASIDVTPTVMRLDKGHDADESETATGPNYPVTYTLTVDIANDALVRNLVVQDTLPDNMQYLDLVDDGGGTATEPSTSVPGGTLSVSMGDVTGGSTSDDVVIIYRAYAPETDSGNGDVLNPDSGSPAPAENDATANGTYDDANGGVYVEDDDAVEVTLRSLAVQKDVARVTDAHSNGTGPDDTLEYTIRFQISDYFAFEDILLTDVVGDGQTFLDTPAPLLSVTEGGDSASWGFTGDNSYSTGDTYTWSHNGATGETTLTFYVSDLLDEEDFGHNADGTLEGDVYHDDAFDGQPATGTITFRTTIDESYEDPSNWGDEQDESLGSGDGTGNTISVQANLLGTDTLVGDNSSAGVSIAVPNITKSIYAINGDTDYADVLVGPGETVTYSIRIEIPVGETEGLEMVDYLPIPFLDADELTAMESQSDTPPSAGSWRLASDDTLSGGPSPLIAPPVLSVDSTQNTVSFNWGTFSEENATDRVAHILFTVTGTDEPMADGLFLANLAAKTCTDSLGNPHAAAAVDHIVTQEPHLTITKGVSTTDGAGTIEPPVSDPVDSDLQGADARDKVTFVVTVENDGSWPAYDVVASEDTPTGLTGCALDMDGVAIDGSPTSSYTGDLFSGGIALDDPLMVGETLTITYTCTVEDSVYPGQELVNTARIEQYSSTDGGDNYVQDSSLYQDDATVTIDEPDIQKSLGTSSESSTDNPGLTIGETGTFEVQVILPEATLYDPVLTDDIPSGLQYVVAGGVTVTTDPTLAALDTNKVISPPAGSNGMLQIAFPGTYSTAGLAEGERTITVAFDLVVLDDISNSWTTPSKVNAATLSWEDGADVEAGSVTDDETIEVVEPSLDVNKSMSPNPATGGQTVTVTISVENIGTSDAFNVTVTDELETAVFDTSTAVDTTASLNGFSYGYADPVVTYSGGTIASGATQAFTFTVDVLDLAIAGSTYPNVAVADYSSLPTDEDDERDYQDSDEENLSIRTAGIGKSLVATSEPDSISSGTNVLIGEVMTYELQIDVPANSTTAGLVVGDNLPASVAYVAATAQIQRSSADVGATGFAFGAVNAFETIAPSSGPDPLGFMLGDVINSGNDPQTISIRFDVVVKNVSANQPGTAINNRATITFTNAQGQDITLRSNRVRTRVNGPSIVLSKTVSPLSVMGGETVTFTVEVQNQDVSYCGPAFDLRVTDELDAYYTNFRDVSWSVLNDAGPAMVVTDNSTSDLDIGIDRMDRSDSLRITFDADVVDDVPHGVSVPNLSRVVATSLPGENGTDDATPGDPGTSTGERLGDGTDANTLWAADDGEVGVYLPSLDKSIVDASPRYAIGEEYTYRVIVGVPAGYSECLGVRDTLPDGVTFKAGSLVVDVPAAVSIENMPATEANSAFFYEESPGSNVYWFRFGEILASDSSDIEVLYTVTIDDEPGNVDGTDLDNEAELHQLVGDDCLLLETDSAQATLGEPDVEITKSVISNTADLENGDEVTFEIVMENTGSITAHVVDFTDTPLPDYFARPVDSLVIASFAPAPVFDDTQLTLSTFDLPPEETVTVYVTAELAGATAGDTIENLAAVDYSSLPGGQGRAYSDEDDATIPIGSGVTIVKDVCPCMPDVDFSIGEHIVFRVRVELKELKTLDVVVTDTLPAGLAPLRDDCQVISGNAGLVYYEPGTTTINSDYNVASGSGQEIVFELGDIDNPANGSDDDDYLDIDIHAKVLNAEGNFAGHSVVNNADVVWTEDSTEMSASDSASADVVEPVLEIFKSVDRVEATVGDEVVYTLTIRHTPESTGTAYDIVVQDTLAPDMDYEAGTATLAPSTYEDDPGERLTFVIPSLTLAQHQVVISYTCRLDDDPSLAEPTPVPQLNTATLTYTSLEGPDDEERDGTDGPGGLNDYADEATEEVTPIIWTSIEADKTVADDNGDELVAGETLTYTILLTNTDDEIVRDVVFTDPIPTHTTYVPGTLQVDKAGATVDDSGNPLIVRIGDMAIDEEVTITFQVRVGLGVREDTVIRNIGIVDSNDTTPSPTDDPTDDESDNDPTDIDVDVEIRAVGGEAMLANKTGLVLPWLAAASVLMAILAVFRPRGKAT